MAKLPLNPRETSRHPVALLLKQYNSGIITRLEYDILVEEIARVDKISKSFAGKKLRNNLDFFNVTILETNLTSPRRRLPEYVDTTFDREKARAEFIKKSRRDTRLLLRDDIKPSTKRNVVKKLTERNKFIVERYNAKQGDVFAKKLLEQRARQLEDGIINFGNNLTDEQQSIAQRIYQAVINGYRRVGVRVLTANLIRSLDIRVVNRDNTTRYILESDVRYAKYVNGYKNFTKYAKSICRALTDTELIINFV